MTQLIPYEETHKETILRQIGEFFGFHFALHQKEHTLERRQAEENLAAWTAPEHDLYVIGEESSPVGFLHIWYKGSNVAWIEDLFVEEAYRGRGIGSRAIREAERMIRKKDGYIAVCMDVVPQNTAALNLYRKLGYDTLSMITVRKELGENHRTGTVELLGHEFKI